MGQTSSSKIKKLLPLPALFLVFVVFIGLLWTLFMNGNTMDIDSEDGSWDLSDINFTETIVRLQGHVEYIPHALLTPEEFVTLESESLLGRGEGLDIVTSRIRIYLPDDSWYTFNRLLLGYSHHRIYVNGEWFQGETREAVTPEATRITFTVQPVNGVVELVHQSMTVHHRWDISHQHWYIGNQGLISNNIRSIDFISSLIIGCFLALFLIHMILYLLQRDYIANLYFALFSLILFLREGFIEPSMFSAAFPWLDWYMEFRIEYVGIPIMAWLLAAMANEVLPGYLPKYFRVVVYAVSSVFALVFLFADITLMIQTMIFGYIFYMIVILYGLLIGIVNFIKNLEKINLEQSILAVAFILLLLSNIYDIYHNSGIQMMPFYANLTFMSAMTRVYFCFCIAAAVFISNRKTAKAAEIAEQQLAVEVKSLAQLNQMKTELMTTISHEVRTPLAVLASYSGLVAMELKNKEGNEQTIANLDKIVDEAKRVANLIDSMNKLTLNKEKLEKRVNLDLSELIEQTAGLYHHIFERSNIKMDLALDAGLFVFASPEELTQVLFNLLQNARNHTEQGEVSIMAKKENDHVVITVSDTGRGIPSELFPNLFERGVSGTKVGMGIGLAICKEVIDDHNGTITVESDLIGINKGTRVIFTLPIIQMVDENKIA